MKWYKEGEKSTKYFLNLEKRNYCNKVISKLRQEDNKLITNPKEILSEQKDFYKELYCSRLDKNIDEEKYKPFFQNIKQKLSVVHSEELEGIITEAELLTAFKSTANGKSPGSDGFTVDFYKFLWKKYKPIIVK